MINGLEDKQKCLVEESSKLSASRLTPPHHGGHNRICRELERGMEVKSEVYIELFFRTILELNS